MEQRKPKRGRTAHSSQDKQILLPLGQPMSEGLRQDNGRMMMKGLLQYRSNRLEVLAAELAGWLASPSDAPLQKEIVIAPSLAMRRWLTLKIARLNGICANVSFPFLADFVGSIPPHVLSPSLSQERIPPEEMIWAIHRILPALLQEAEFKVVGAYLSDSDPLKLFQLSKRIAELFDQYAVYRPEMVSSWELASSNKLTGDEAWQRTLWRALTADEGVRQAKEKLAQENADRVTADLPGRLFVFGVTAIPPVYLDVLFQLAKTKPVHLFLLQSSNEYHGDDLTPKQRARRNIPETEAPTGNPLLSSLGCAQAQLTELLIDADERLGGVLVDQEEKFAAPEPAHLLGMLQADIFAAVNRPSSGVSPDESRHRFPVQPDDESLLIHSCHSPMREVEVVYDQLLHLFEKDSTLRPRDILVLTPDIEKYSPLIHAVFEYTEQNGRKIPYSVSDRHPRSASVVVDSFLQILELSTSRCAAEEVFALVSSPLIAQRFEFSDDDLARIRTWIRETHICWGIDGAQREQLGLPATQANTWRYGFDRLLLGYAMRGQNARLFDHVLPYDEVEGEGGELLGRLVSAVETIFSFVNRFGIARPLSQWTPVLRETVDQLFESDDEAHIRDLRFLRRTFARLETAGTDLRASQPVDIRVLRTHLGNLFGAMEQRGGFLTGGVTFAALKPGRSIPARVIFLLGMNDDVFPRRPQLAQFDLMARRRLGDPSPREDDRYAFLETICAAQNSLQISYVGRSNIHNEAIPPSIVVNELLDYAEQACIFPASASARQHILVEHPLQAFSPRYFNDDDDDERLFSFSEANAAAARALINPATAIKPLPFLVHNVPEASAVERAISLNQLISFLAGPARFFLKARFRMDLKQYDNSLPDDEPLELGPLEKYQIRQDLLTEWIDSGASNLEVFTARGMTAPGMVGQLQLRSFDRDAANFRSTVLPYIRDQRTEPIAIDLHLGEFTLSGLIESVYGPNIVYYRCAKLNVRDRLRAWVEHLARSAVDRKARFKTLLIGKDDVLCWSPIDTAADLLADLCRLYWRGLHEPVPFFPRSALAYALAEKGGSGNPAAKARSAWNGDFRSDNGEKHDPHIVELFRDPDPVAEESVALTQRIWMPLLKHTD